MSGKESVTIENFIKKPEVQRVINPVGRHRNDRRAKKKNQN